MGRWGSEGESLKIWEAQWAEKTQVREGGPGKAVSKEFTAECPGACLSSLRLECRGRRITRWSASAAQRVQGHLEMQKAEKSKQKMVSGGPVGEGRQGRTGGGGSAGGADRKESSSHCSCWSTKTEPDSGKPASQIHSRYDGSDTKGA